MAPYLEKKTLLQQRYEFNTSYKEYRATVRPSSYNLRQNSSNS